MSSGYLIAVLLLGAALAGIALGETIRRAADRADRARMGRSGAQRLRAELERQPAPDGADGRLVGVWRRP